MRITSVVHSFNRRIKSLIHQLHFSIRSSVNRCSPFILYSGMRTARLSFSCELLRITPFIPLLTSFVVHSYMPLHFPIFSRSPWRKVQMCNLYHCSFTGIMAGLRHNRGTFAVFPCSVRAQSPKNICPYDQNMAGRPAVMYISLFMILQ